MAVVKGYVEHIVYRNTENGYPVMEVKSGQQSFTLVGSLPTIQEGEPLEAEGSFVTHPVYGEQLQVSSFTVTEPKLVWIMLVKMQETSISTMLIMRMMFLFFVLPISVFPSCA